MPRKVSNPPNPWSTTHVEWLEEPPDVELEVYEEHSRSIIAANDSPDIGFRHSVNPYRGCQHACAYCYARPSHQYLGLGAGTDFDTKIVVKVDAARLLARDIDSKLEPGETLVFSGVTDCYQPLEASYGLTRACLQVCARHDVRVAIITKSALIRRDLDLLAALAGRDRARVHVSLPFIDPAMARAVEPWAAAPHKRLETIRALTEAGVRVGVGLAPVIPALNEPQIPAILEAAREAGATSAFMTLVRLPAEVRPVFEQRIRQIAPDRAEHVLSAIRDTRGGAMYDARFGHRMHGRGERWNVVRQLFELHRRRLGFDASDMADRYDPRPAGKPTRPPQQGSLFDEPVISDRAEERPGS